MSKNLLGFATCASLMTIVFLWTINMYVSPQVIWFIYPSFFSILWPLSLYMIQRKKHAPYALVTSILITVLLIATNYLYSPQHPWFLYVAFPVIWWPITMYVGKKAKTVAYALIVAACTIVYYTVLNLSMTPGYLWAIYPTFVVLWWPISLYFARKQNFFGLSVAASILTIVFFSTANWISTPNTLWAIYPIFLILWWPLSMYFFVYQKQKQRQKRGRSAGL